MHEQTSFRNGKHVIFQMPSTLDLKIGSMLNAGQLSDLYTPFHCNACLLYNFLNSACNIFCLGLALSLDQA